jgi:MoaA/NifB/PqqE/SkfB family radical SAM enzyme
MYKILIYLCPYGKFFFLKFYIYNFQSQLHSENMYSINDAYNGKASKSIGAMLRGWDVPAEHYRDPDRLPVVDFRAFTHNCPHDCFHCYTDKNRKTLTFKEIKGVIDQLADVGTYAINYLGEGEPTMDKDFLKVLAYTESKNIIPVVFTEGATMMRDPVFVRLVRDYGASVVPKCDSLFNAQYQNWVVGDRTGKYFDQRNEAVQVLMEAGFNKIRDDGTTRMGFDMVVSTKNMDEIGKTLRYCRDNNLWIVFAHYLPSGRSGMEGFDKSLMLFPDEKRVVAEEVKTIDSTEYNYDHRVKNNFLTTGCVEHMQIYGDGRVSPCPGNETIIGNVKENRIKELRDRIVEKFPELDRTKFDGNCPYREKYEA